MLPACHGSVTVSKRAEAPVNSLRRCPDLDKPKVGESNEAYTNRVIDMYYAGCAIPHDALIEYTTATPAPEGTGLFNFVTH